MEKLKILIASSEVAPFAKTGGLGDVASALPKALAAMGHRVTVAMPLYGGVSQAGMKKNGMEAEEDMDGRKVKGSWLSFQEGEGAPEFLFLRQEKLFGSRPNPYGDDQGDYPDNDRRFIFFNRAVRSLALRTSPHVIHANDWQTGLLPVYLSEDRREGHCEDIVSVFSIHNLSYQGHFPAGSFPLTGLREELFGERGVEHYGKLALLKSGILFADGITAVSPTYAEEILGSELGFGLEPYLNERKESLKGILNGIDQEEWNPAADPHLPANYGPSSPEGKRECRSALLKAMGLKDDGKRPVVGVVSRLIEQKGFDMVARAGRDLMESGDFYFVVLGSGQKEYEEAIKGLAEKYPQRVGLKLGFDNPLAHLIEAGSDIFLMPSRFEPCGLNQMYSLRYGTIPVVRATGGLNDTVSDHDPGTGEGDGFVFRRAETKEMLKAFRRALHAYRDKELWSGLMARGMKRDFSWDRSAREYLSFYLELLSRR